MKTSKSVILSRQDEILSYIQRNNYIKISELAKVFGVSTATIRRDISTLEESGEDIRCKGGICIADTGNVAGFEASVQMDIRQVPGLKNKLLGGEGLFNTLLTGPGKVWLQTMPIAGVAAALMPYFPSGN